MLETETIDTSLFSDCHDRLEKAMLSFDNNWLFWANKGLEASQKERADFLEEVKRNPPPWCPGPTPAKRQATREYWQRVMATETYQNNRERRKLRYRVKTLEAENRALRLRDEAHRQGCGEIYQEFNQLITDLYSASIHLAQATSEDGLRAARDKASEIRLKLHQLLPKITQSRAGEGVS